MSHSQRSIRVTASRRCPAPNISSVTVDHDDSCELPPSEGGGSPNQCCGHSRTRTRADTGIPARTPPLRLPRQSTTAELLIVNLIAQHDPEANAQLPRRRNAGFREALLHDLPSIETLQVRIAPHRIPAGFPPYKSHKPIALLAHLPQPLPSPPRF